jgi:CPA1 family monovalent cation:H+ antiporter
MNFIPNLADPISSITQIEIAVIIGLLIITLVAILVRRINIPYTVALVVAGLALALARSYQIFNFQIPDQAAAGELILALFVPLLVFEGALHVNWRSFKLDLIPILLLAVAGVLVAMFIVGGVILGIDGLLELATGVFEVGFLGEIQGIPFLAALAFGALIAATDPVAVIAFFRSLGVDKRLSQLMEGESLFNDGTSIVIFKLALAIGGVTAAASGEAQAGFSLSGIVWNFISVAVGGLVVGLLVGVLADVAIYRNLDDMLVETTITLPVAFGSYILAEQFQLSGILAVVAAGIYLGNRIPVYTTPSTRLSDRCTPVFLRTDSVFGPVRRDRHPGGARYGHLWDVRLQRSFGCGNPEEVPACDVLGRAARRDQPSPGLESWGERFRPGDRRTAQTDDLRCSAVHAYRAGHNH